jgi:hypothetical protein
VRVWPTFRLSWIPINLENLFRKKLCSAPAAGISLYRRIGLSRLSAWRFASRLPEGLVGFKSKRANSSRTVAPQSANGSLSNAQIRQLATH